MGTKALGSASQIVGKSSGLGIFVGAADEVPTFECLDAGWVDDDIGLFFFMDKVAEGGDITQLCAPLPAIVRRWTGSGS